MAQKPGILGSPAPQWSISEWANLDRATSRLEIDDFRGKILYLYCFQSWCPGCHATGFPTLQVVSERFKDDPDVAFVTVQTSFEGFQANTFERAKEVMKKYRLTIPLGQSGTHSKSSALMARYRTGGTP